MPLSKFFLEGYKDYKNTEDEEKSVDLSKIPKDVLINAHIQLLNKGVPENQRYYTSNIGKASKDKVLEHIKKQKYSMKEFEKLVNELFTNKKEENKKGLAKRKQTAKEIEEMNKSNFNINMFISDKQKEIDEGLKKRKNKKKTYKESNIMKGRSDLKKKTNGKYEVETELNIKKGLEPKVQRALKKSVNEELTKGFKGGSINLDYSDSSSDEEKEVKKKVDINELRNYAKMLSHLLDHIEDPKEPIDKKDYKDVKKLIDNMEKVKKGRGRPRKH